MIPEHLEDIYPLAPLQQGLLYHTLAAPDSTLYMEQLSWTLEGVLDVDAYRRAWQGALERHPVLRTAFEPHRAVFPVVDHQQAAGGGEGEAAPPVGQAGQGEGGEDGSRGSVMAALPEQPDPVADRVIADRRRELDLAGECHDGKKSCSSR